MIYEGENGVRSQKTKKYIEPSNNLNIPEYDR